MSQVHARVGLALLVGVVVSGCQAPNVPVYAERADFNLQRDITGELAVQDGCLVLVTEDTVYLVLWPAGTTWDEVTDAAELGGQRVAVGSTVTLDGGEGTSEPVDDPSAWETAPTDECLAIERVWQTYNIMRVDSARGAN